MLECWGATNPLEVVDCKETLQGYIGQCVPEASSGQAGLQCISDQ